MTSFNRNSNNNETSNNEIGFNPDTLCKLFEVIWVEQSNNKPKPNTLELCAEYLRLITNVAMDRAITLAKTDEVQELDETYIRKIVIQLLLDFR
jgi:hypothetical protein